MMFTLRNISLSVFAALFIFQVAAVPNPHTTPDYEGMPCKFGPFIRSSFFAERSEEGGKVNVNC